MFGLPKREVAPKLAIQTLIGAETVIRGDISFSGGLRIDGQVIGNVVSEGEHGMIVVSEAARIEGEVKAAHLVINGTIVGPVQGTRLIELQPRARVTGDVSYKALEMHHGSVVDGRLIPQADAGSEVRLLAHEPQATDVPAHSRDS
jgi:cytoskeletal protein CcmA (bactofilin family)